jgi:CDP-2,3-bis-(O-geranylgeranyl)-sn-glycerol synthase
VWSIQELIDLPALLLLMVANSTPVILARILGARYAAPIDANRSLSDGHRLLGSHKTWRGIISGTLAAGIAGTLLARGFATGAVFGALALTGDLVSSFLKRRLGCRSGQSIPLLDQLPEALLPMLVLRGAMALEPAAIIGTALAFMLLDLLTARFRA